jgi:hypothetical protein
MDGLLLRDRVRVAREESMFFRTLFIHRLVLGHRFDVTREEAHGVEVVACVGEAAG